MRSRSSYFADALVVFRLQFSIIEACNGISQISVRDAIPASKHGYVNSHLRLTNSEQKFEPAVCNSVTNSTKLPMRRNGRGHYLCGKSSRGVKGWQGRGGEETGWNTFAGAP